LDGLLLKCQCLADADVCGNSVSICGRKEEGREEGREREREEGGKRRGEGRSKARSEKLRHGDQEPGTQR
jgi:hypothetical protein